MGAKNVDEIDTWFSEIVQPCSMRRDGLANTLSISNVLLFLVDNFFLKINLL